jgi:hypothetical protein
MCDKIFSDQEVEKLIVAAVSGNGGLCPESKIFKFLGVCQWMRVQGFMIDLLLSGKLKVDISKSAANPIWMVTRNDDSPDR